jgi:hypothetical protein
VLIDQLADPALQQRRNCVAGVLAIVLTHSTSSACIAFIIQKPGW